MPEFASAALEALRQPLEDGVVRIHRARGETVYPARTQLVLAANPCPCAKPGGDRMCECSPLARRRYLGRLSGPLLDRVDLRIKLDPVRTAALLDDQVAESSAVVGARVRAARAAAAARWGGHTNASVPAPTLRDRGHRLPREITAPLTADLDRGLVTARGFFRVIRTAWTIADLDGRARPDRGDVAEAVDLRRGTI